MKTHPDSRGLNSKPGRADEGGPVTKKLMLDARLRIFRQGGEGGDHFYGRQENGEVVHDMTAGRHVREPDALTVNGKQDSRSRSGRGPSGVSSSRGRAVALASTGLKGVYAEDSSSIGTLLVAMQWLR